MDDRPAVTVTTETEEPAAPARTRRRVPWPVVVLVALAVLVAGLWRAGGFRTSADTVHEFSAGETVDLGPMTVTVRNAKAVKGYDELWLVRVYGTCEVSTPEGMSFYDKGWLFATAADTPRPRLVGEPRDVVIDPANASSLTRLTLAAGMPIECAFESQMPEGYSPAQGIRLGLMGIEMRDRSILQDQGKRWSSNGTTHLVTLPVHTVTEF